MAGFRDYDKVFEDYTGEPMPDEVRREIGRELGIPVIGDSISIQSINSGRGRGMYQPTEVKLPQKYEGPRRDFRDTPIDEVWDNLADDNPLKHMTVRDMMDGLAHEQLFRSTDEQGELNG